MKKFVDMTLKRDSGILIKRDNSLNAFIGFDEPSKRVCIRFYRL